MIGQINQYTLEEINALIAEVDHDCNAVQLLKDLNIFIKHYIIMADQPEPNKKQKVKEINDFRTEAIKYYDQTIEKLQKASAILYLEKKNMTKFGVSINQLNHSILTNLQAVDYYTEQKNKVLQLADKNLSFAEQGTYFSFKNVMLCSVLPNIYIANFNKKLGFSRSGLTGNAGGPALRFIHAVSKKVGNEMSYEAIIKSYKRMHE